ncbi:hypothetical protein MAPG_02696 [Magnaporthiopsis poae ATCC 64411]|uniref:Uncharacterized protein n=1 Tax=Magnaporthiopsis poae (strain ATCC 64411 / 73-15) TaxID=644358 RepID=A0A0C4DS25_MAGP6|nr:hypothetical protein MAPG_02696 [Magnaporthiopsis poae ATCC 64411]
MHMLRIALLGLAGFALAQHDGMDSMDHMATATTGPSTLLVAPGTPSVPSTTVPTILTDTDTAVVPLAATSTTTGADHDPHATMSHAVSNRTSTSHTVPVPTTTGAPLPAGAPAMSATSAGVIALVFALGFAVQY